MIVFFILLIVVILLIVDIFRYQKAKANAFSEEEVIRAASAHAEKYKYQDPILSCDYCGAKIDTRIHRHCPQCGAAYDRDKEWTARHDVTDAFIEKGTNEVIRKREIKSREEKRTILKRIMIEIAVLAVSFVVLLVLGSLGFFILDSREYKKTENVNVHYGEDYVKADYSVEGDGVIYDCDGVKVTLTGFYVSETSFGYGEEEDWPNTKAEFRIQNNYDKNISISLYCNSINGTANESSYIYSFDYFRKNADVTVYFPFRADPKGIVSEMIFSRVDVASTDYDYENHLKEPVVIHTTKKSTSTPDLKDYVHIFTNDHIEIYARAPKDDLYHGYSLKIINKSGYDLFIGSRTLKVNGEEVNSNTIYDEYLPSGYCYYSKGVYPFNMTWEELKAQKSEVNMSFKNEDDPSMDFSTGFIDLSSSID